VDDEGGFWDSRDLGKLAEALRQYDSMVAGFTGAVRGIVERQGIAVQSPMAGRPDFERRELQGQAGLADILQELKKNGWM
jgi:predicted NUDIX family NTP pyrophosphohydrolase